MPFVIVPVIAECSYFIKSCKEVRRDLKEFELLYKA